MSKDPGDATTPVRRSARARKPNSRFADDEVEGCFKKIVTGIGLPETTTSSLPSTVIGRPKKTIKKKDCHSEEKSERKSEEEDGTEKCVKSKLEFLSDESQREVKGCQVLSEALASAKKDVKDTALDVLVNGLGNEDETEKSSVEKLKAEREETIETGRKGRFSKREEMECSPKETKKRVLVGKKRGKGKKSEEEEEPEGNKSSDKEMGSVNGDGEDKNKNSNVEADKLASVASMMADEKARKIPDTGLCKMDIDESEGSTSSVINSRLGKPGDTDCRLEDAASGESSQCEYARSEKASFKCEGVTGTENEENRRLESSQTDEIGGKTKNTDISKNIKEKQPAKIDVYEKNIDLINGDISSENVHGRKSSEMSSSTCTRSLEGDTENIEKLVDSSHREKSFKDSVENVPLDKTPSDSKESSDAYGSSISGGEARDKIQGGKSGGGRRRLIQSDSTDSTDSDTSSPVRRRGRSGHQVLSEGLGDDRKERSSLPKGNQPHPKASSQPTKTVQSPAKVLTPPAKAAHRLTKPEQSPSKDATTVPTKAIAPLPTKATAPATITVQSPAKAPVMPSKAHLPSRAEPSSGKSPVVPSKLVQSTKASLPSKTPTSAVELPAKASVVQPTKVVQSPARVSESPTKSSAVAVRVVELSTRAAESPTKTLLVPAKALESPVKTSVVQTKAVESPTKSPSLPSKATSLSVPAKAFESSAKTPSLPSKAPSLSVPAKAFESPAKTPSLSPRAKDSSPKSVEPPVKAVELPVTTVESPVKASPLPAKVVESPAKAPPLPARDVELPTKTPSIPIKAPELPVKTVDSPPKYHEDVEPSTKTIELATKSGESPAKAVGHQHTTAKTSTQAPRPIEPRSKTVLTPTKVSLSAKPAQSAAKTSFALPRAEQSDAEDSLSQSPTRVAQSSTKASAPLNKSELSSTKTVQLSPKASVLPPPMASPPSAKGRASLSKTGSPTAKVSEPQKKKDDHKEKQLGDACGGSRMCLPNFSFETIPLPPETQQTASALCKLVEESKSERERNILEEHKRSETVEAHSSSPEGEGMPKTKKRREEESSSEQESQIPYYSEDDQKRKLPIESRDIEYRKRRKVEHNLPVYDDTLPKDTLSETDDGLSLDVEQYSSSRDVPSASHISPPSDVKLSTNFEDKSTNMLNVPKENNSEFSKNRKSSDEHVISVSESCPLGTNFRLEEIQVPQGSNTNKEGESGRQLAGIDHESMKSPYMSKENIDQSDSDATGAFMHVSLPLDGSSIPFISDSSGVSGSCEIPGLSILSSKCTDSELSSRLSNPKDDISKVSGDIQGLLTSAAVGTASLLKDRNLDSMGEYHQEKNIYISKQVKVEQESNAGVGGSRVEDIHMEDDLRHEDTTVKMKTESEVSLPVVKIEEHSFGSKVEEIKLTDEELKEQERKQVEKDRRNKEVVEQRLKSFTHLEENVYLGERRKTKRSKEVRRMLCDCSLTKEEIARGDVGCGDDCLNRLLMIECGSRCPLKDRCTNKRFQRKEYADVEVFNADEKGCGLRARSSMPPGTFIMEYVGEVFDTREFKRRRKEYARDQTAHFYFMALKSDLLIDATRMGNISRFINHSCDPNAETQKWTVNGELRIGFFSKKQIDAGVEINFDYRLERYGREPQKCYCGTQICRGWLGESPDEKTKEEKDEERRKEERDRRKREERRAYFEDIDLEDELEKLNSHKLRNRQDTLNLSRLLVRVEDYDGRLRLLHLLQTGEAACRRLFLDYHGLKVLWSLMADLSTSLQHTTLKIEILKTLECLPITNKTQLTDSRVLALVERWSTQKADSTTITVSGVMTIKPSSPLPSSTTELSMLPPSTVLSDSDTNKKSSDTSEESDSELDIKMTSNAIEASSADDSSLDSEVDQPAVSQKQGIEEESSDSSQSDSKENPTTPNKEMVKEEEDEEATGVTKIPDKEKEAQELQNLHNSMVTLALKLLDTWKNLKEFFRIPKKERIEMMKEHEREVDRGYKEYLDREEDSDRDWEGNRREKEQGRYVRRDYYYDRRRRSPDRDRHGRIRSDRNSRDDRSSDSPKMSKEKRRQLFELKVQQEEEEAKQRKMQEEMWAMHVDRCRLLGHDPYLTPIFDPTYQYYWDPVAANWQPYTGSDINIPVPAGYGQHKTDGEGGSPLTVLIPGQTQGGQAHIGLLPHATDTQVGPDDPLNPANIPLPGEIPALTQASPSQPHPGQAVPVEGTPPQGAKVLSIPLPGEISGTTMMDPGAASLDGEEEPPPPPPGPITIQLPPRWKIARDAQGHVYFYHVKTRASQWEPPSLDQHNQIQAELGSDSDSDSSSSDTDSTSTSDSEDFSSEEEEEEVVETVTRSEVSDEKMIRRVRGKKRRSEALVQERVISPIMEIDREAARRERREAKERAREEARQERQERQEELVARMETVEAGETRTRQEHHETSSSSNSSTSTSTTTSTSTSTSTITSGTITSTSSINTTPSVLASSSSNSSRSKREKSKERAATAIADNSDAARKIKDNFRSKMATYIVSVLNPYRKLDCKEGKITCTEDFKYLARKLTHFVMVKELKQLHSIEALECSDSVKHKTKDFVRKYMSKYGSVFKRDPNDTKEY